MIRFNCPTCQRAFEVPDNVAGRKAVCKNCRAPLVVPAATSVAPVSRPGPEVAGRTQESPATGLSVRTRRLMADAEQMQRAFARFEPIRLRSTQGQPPELFQIEYRVQSIEGIRNGDVIHRDTHLVEIQLTSQYPMLAPKCRMLTPIYHPNIDESAICVADHWTAAERLVDLVTRIGEMIAYQAYNIKSPLNGDAAMWADLHAEQFPTDPRDLHSPEL